MSMVLHFPPTEEAIETVHLTLSIKIRKENLQDTLGPGISMNQWGTKRITSVRRSLKPNQEENISFGLCTGCPFLKKGI